MWWPGLFCMPSLAFSLRAPLVVQSCPTLCDPMDYSLPGPSVHGISQARMLEWVAISFSRGSSWPRDWTCISCVFCVSCIAGRFFTLWTIREAIRHPMLSTTLEERELLSHFFFWQNLRIIWYEWAAPLSWPLLNLGMESIPPNHLEEEWEGINQWELRCSFQEKKKKEGY